MPVHLHCENNVLQQVQVIVGQPLPQPQLQPQLELEAKEAINSMENRNMWRQRQDM